MGLPSALSGGCGSGLFRLQGSKFEQALIFFSQYWRIGSGIKPARSRARSSAGRHAGHGGSHTQGRDFAAESRAGGAGRGLRGGSSSTSSFMISRVDGPVQLDGLGWQMLQGIAFPLELSGGCGSGLLRSHGSRLEHFSIAAAQRCRIVSGGISKSSKYLSLAGTHGGHNVAFCRASFCDFDRDWDWDLDEKNATTKMKPIINR